MDLEGNLHAGGIFFLVPEGVTTVKAFANPVLCDHIKDFLDKKLYPEDLLLDEDAAMDHMEEIGKATIGHEQYRWPFLMCESCASMINIIPTCFVNRRLDVLIEAFGKMGGEIFLCADRKWRLIVCDNCRREKT